MKKFFHFCFPAFFSALLLTLASPGFDQWYLAYIALVPVITAAYTAKRPFLLFFVFGFIYFFYNLRWIEVSVADLGGASSFVGYLAAGGFSAFLALFWGLFGWLVASKKNSPMLMAGVLICLEIVRGTVFTGFPWLNLSHTQYNFTPVIQSAEIAGEHFISLMIAYFNLSIAAFIKNRNKHSLAFASLFLCAFLAYGFISAQKKTDHKVLKARLVQPAYSQSEKWNPASQADIFLTVSQMIRDSGFESRDLLMLPETVYPAFLQPDFPGHILMRLVSETTPVISGGIRYAEDKGERIYYNSVFLFENGKVRIYDKRHLVPFGEYFPLGGLFKPIDYYFFKGAEDYTKGTEPVVFNTSAASFAPLVCYESAYSRLIRPQIEKGADIITVVTNDSWFGMTQGPAQHLAADVMRAVEFRRTVLRSAQSGISACINPKGEITGSLPLNKKDYLDCEAELSQVKTVFASAGYGWLPIFLAVVYLWDRRKKKINNN